MDDNATQPTSNSSWQPTDKDNSNEPTGDRDSRVGVPDVDPSAPQGRSDQEGQPADQSVEQPGPGVGPGEPSGPSQ